MPGRRRKTEQTYVMISVVAERYGIHPQTLRLYEREGLITPARSAGNTRLYDQEAIRRLEIILTLTRELGVNLGKARGQTGEVGGVHGDHSCGVGVDHAMWWRAPDHASTGPALMDECISTGR